KHYSSHINGSWLYIVPDISAKGTAHWSGYLLLAVYAGSQVASTYFMGSTMDRTQRNIMMVLPVLFLTVVAHFPVGLIIYWMTTNLWTVGQGLVTRKLIPKPGAKGAALPTAPKRSSRTPAKEPEATAGNGAAPKPEPAKPKAPAKPRRVKRNRGGSRR